MPNLNYNPKNPRDILGRDLAEGDIVAWGTNYGQSAALTICMVVKIRFTREQRGSYSTRSKEVPQHMAEAYSLQLRPIYGTGEVTNREYVPGGFINENGNEEFFRPIPWEEWKVKSVKLVKNVVKLDLTLEEVMQLVEDNPDKLR